MASPQWVPANSEPKIREMTFPIKSLSQVIPSNWSRIKFPMSFRKVISVPNASACRVRPLTDVFNEFLHLGEDWFVDSIMNPLPFLFDGD